MPSTSITIPAGLGLAAPAVAATPKEFGAYGNGAVTTGSISASDPYVPTAPGTFTAGQAVLVTGAGASGDNLSTTVSIGGTGSCTLADTVQTARSRRRQLLQIPARLTPTSRQWTLRMPTRWPWQTDFNTVLDAIRELPRAHLTATPVRDQHQPTPLPTPARPACPKTTGRHHPRRIRALSNRS